MKLEKLCDVLKMHNGRDLINCKICGEVTPYYMALKNNWLTDVATNTIYCPDCVKFLINKLDDVIE